MIKNRRGLLLLWSDKGWKQYTTLIKINRKSIKRINRLIKSIQRDGHRKGLGQPEPLKHIKWQLGTEIWSRRIDKQNNRLVYIISSSPKINEFMVSSCRYHYLK